MKFYEIGEQLFRRGDFERGIPACMACHGPSGAGNPGPAYPQVGGQQAWYTARRLEEYRAGTTNERDTTMFEIMAEVANGLTDQEISALASYMQGLHRRPDAATLAMIAEMPAPAPAEAPAAPAETEAGTEATGGETAEPAGADAPATDADLQQAP